MWKFLWNFVLKLPTYYKRVYLYGIKWIGERSKGIGRTNIYYENVT